jgi:hypothetical protein
MTKGHAAALDGLVQSVLPASVWNMADGTFRFPRNLGVPGDNAPHESDCGEGADRARVCAEALLKLAHWCQRRRQSASGGELCPTLRMTESPPAHSGGGNVRGAGATLGSATASHASERPADTEPCHRSATPNATDGAGGVA